MNSIPLLLAAGVMLMTSVVAAAADPAPKNQAATDNNAFAFDLYAKVRAKNGNIFFSPTSISTALAMTYSGAKGATADEMAQVLHFSLGQDNLHPAFAALLKELNGDGIDPAKRSYQLAVANALWGQTGYPWKADFLKTMQANYGAGLHEVNFAESEQARQTINAWIEKQTNDKIKDLISRGDLSSDTRLVLTNAIYFKGDWASQFDKKATLERNFTLAADKSVKVPMMHRKGDYRLFQNDELQMLDLPYKSNDLSMLILLPRRATGLPELEKQLTLAKFEEFVKNLQKDEVEVALPKFKLEEKLQLGADLQALGMKNAFTNKADFSGMADAEKLSLSAVIHQAFVDVNEEGTEAAAATAVGIRAMAARLSPVFRADHPFIFVIRDNRNGSVLFLGRVSEPSGK